MSLLLDYHFKFEEKKKISKIPDLDTRALVAKL